MLKISIILTTFNPGRIIHKTLDSILSQKGIDDKFKLELIVVDDCSHENIQDLCEEENIFFESTKINSGGPNKGRNIGLNLCSGDYIIIADQDDIWEKSRILNYLPFCNEFKIMSCGFFVDDSFNNKDRLRLKNDNKGYKYYKKNETFLDKLKRSKEGQNTYLGSIMFSKSLKNIFFEEDFGFVDYDWILKIFHKNDSIEICKSLYTRHVNKKNLSLQKNYRIKEFYYCLMFTEQYQKSYPQEVRKGNLRIHGSRARFHYVINEMSLARFYFVQSEKTLVTFLYYLTTFFGNQWVKRRFNVFG